MGFTFLPAFPPLDPSLIFSEITSQVEFLCISPWGKLCFQGSELERKLGWSFSFLEMGWQVQKANPVMEPDGTVAGGRPRLQCGWTLWEQSQETLAHFYPLCPSGTVSLLSISLLSSRTTLKHPFRHIDGQTESSLPNSSLPTSLHCCYCCCQVFSASWRWKSLMTPLTSPQSMISSNS